VANFLDQHCFAVVDGRVGSLTPTDDPVGGQFANAFVVLRANRVASNGGVLVSGLTRDVLVEGTWVSLSDHNVTVDPAAVAVLIV
jgi:hypothetical protein